MRRNLNWFLRRFIIGKFAREVYPTKITGAENLPAGPCVVVAGPHKSGKETIIIPGYLQYREFTIMVKAELFKIPVVGWVLREGGCIPVPRGNGRGIEAVAPAIDALNHGKTLLIFPEATRRHDDFTHVGKTGAIRFALKAGVPIVIIALKGMRGNGPREMIICKPYDPQIERRLILRKLANEASDGLVLRLLTAGLMRRMAKVSGTKYIEDKRGNKA
ncbi:MAG: lysophospholipid acyltransferase family protein [Candidatus Saccharimonadales bacterium]